MDIKNKHHRIKDLKEISIAIDNWDDIFSDFDPRPLNERELSEDFIIELTRRYRETPKGNFLIIINAPMSLSDPEAEKKCIQRVKRHFKHRHLQRHKEIMNIRIKGIIFVVFGICFLGFLSLATYYKYFSTLTIEMLGIVLMPLGWFGIWEGFSKIVDTSPAFIKEETIFKKLANASYKFKYIAEHID